MTPTELQQFLTEFAADRLAIYERHVAGARVVGHYDFNNTYQYVINREETHLVWLQDALAELGGAMPAPSRVLSVPELPSKKKKTDSTDLYRGLLQDDASHLGSFVERWRPKMAGVTHARHRIMLDVVLGESLEHKRFFDQAAGGMEDVLGRRTGGVERQGSVLPARWQE